MGNHLSSTLVCLVPAASALQTTLRMTMEERAAARQFGFNTGSYMPQKLDHFTAADGRSFDQRYYENKAYWSPRAQPEAPVFLYLGGEAPLYGPPSGFVEELAREFGALVVALEHRYYGKSQPFDEITTDNLAFLSSGQALLDAVAFQRFYCEGLRGAPPCPRRTPAPLPASQPRRRPRAASGVACSSPWIVFGGSYAGALAAWTRAFFPKHFHGAVASSGVVQARALGAIRRAIRRNSLTVYRRRAQLDLDFWRFDRQVALSYGAQCAELMSRTYRTIDMMLSEPSLAQVGRCCLLLHHHLHHLSLIHI